MDRYTVEGDLRRFNALNIKRLKEIGCYRGRRHYNVCRARAGVGGALEGGDRGLAPAAERRTVVGCDAAPAARATCCLTLHPFPAPTPPAEPARAWPAHQEQRSDA